MAKKSFYKEQKCKNPLCPEGKFIPTRSDRLYCSKKCKNKHHNDEKKKAKETTYKEEGELRHNEKAMEKLFNSHQFPDHKVPQAFITYEEIKLEICPLKKNTKTGGKIYYAHGFGVELIDPVNQIYQIHKLSA